MERIKASIRKAGIKDAGIILEMFKEFMKDHEEYVSKSNPDAKPQLERKKDAPEIFRKYLMKNIMSKDAEVNIAEVGGKAAGYSLINIGSNVPIFKIEKFGYISDMFVRKGFRGLGLSTGFKEAAEEWFRKKGLKYMSIRMYEGNRRAHAVYKGWGFKDCQIEMRKRI